MINYKYLVDTFLCIGKVHKKVLTKNYYNMNIENTIYVVLKKGGVVEFFPKPKSNSLMTIIKKINDKNLSLEEAEEKASITKGAMLKAIKENDMLSPMDGFNLFNALLD